MIMRWGMCCAVLVLLLGLGFWPGTAQAAPGGSWLEAVVLDQRTSPMGSLPGIYDVDFALDNRGSTIAAWVVVGFFGAAEGSSVFTAQYVPGIGWGVPISHSSGSLRPVDMPRIAMSPEGQVVLLWRETEGRPLDNRTDYIYALTGACCPALLASWKEDNRSESFPMPDVGIDAAGNALAVWQQWDGVRDRVYVSRLRQGEAWDTPIPVDAGIGQALFPRLAVDSSGRAAVAWINSTVGPFRGEFAVQVRRFEPKTGWGSIDTIGQSTTQEKAAGVQYAALVGDGPHPAFHEAIQFNLLDMALDPSGRIAVTWEELPFTQVRISTYAPSTGWSAPKFVGEAGGGWPGLSGPRIALDASGDVNVIWTSVGDANHPLPIKVARFGGTGGRSDQILGSGVWPSIESNAAGNLVAVWAGRGDRNTSGTTASRYSPARGWETPLRLGWGYPTPPPFLATNSQGDAVVGWTQFAYDPNFPGNWARAKGISLLVSLSPDPYPPPLNVVQPIDGTTTVEPVIVVSGATEPGATVTVEGIVAAVGPDGSFSVSVGLSEGTNELTAVARDRASNEATATVRVTYVNPVPTLEQQIQDLQHQIQDAYASVASLSVRQLGLVIALAVSVAVIALLFVMSRMKGRGGFGPGRMSLVAPKPPETGSSNSGSQPSPPREPAPAGMPRRPAPPLTTIRLTAKERILLHLRRYIAQSDAAEVPPEMTQEGIAAATWIDQRHFAQYVNPLVRDGLVRERTAHVRNGRQRRRVYELTDTGTRVAARLFDRVKGEVVKVWDGEHIWEVRLGEVLEKVRGKAYVLDVVRSALHAGVVDLAALAADQEGPPDEPDEASL